MKRIYLLLMLLAATAFNLAAQDDYKPFVEQGKRWVCRYVHDHYEESYTENYQYVIRGTEEINGESYARVLKFKEGQDESQAEVYCYVREEGHRVYVRNAHFSSWVVRVSDNPEEYVLYDFENPNIIFPSDFLYFEPTEPIQGRNAFASYDNLIVEGIGFDSESEGDPFTFFFPLNTSGMNECYGLRYVEDAEGNIIYKGSYYDQFPPVSGLTANKIRDEKLKVRTEEGKLFVEATSAGVVDLVNAYGVVVGRSRVEAGSAVISTTHLPAGVYIVQLSTPTGRQTAKIVVR